jgi:ElaB/YqjD/DUF883 family membrane-anchored ribosome-binding protein
MQGSPVNRLEPHWPETMVAHTSEDDDSTWSGAAKSWEHTIECFMGDHPKLTLAAAATVGLLLGWMVKRK